MNPRSLHVSENELLMLADGELARRKAEFVRAHLAVCQECKRRSALLEERLVDISTVLDQFKPALGDASGPRELLRARLAEERYQPSTKLGRQFSPAPYSRALTYICLFGLLTFGSYRIVMGKIWLDWTSGPRQLPDPRYTPGSTRQASLSELCVMDREEVVRTVPYKVQQDVFREYGIKGSAATNYEVDYLITPGLGGADDLKNLWPEPHSSTPWNSYVKDQLEDRLHRLVCEHKVPLEQAQRDIARDWISAYKEYYQTDRPLASARSGEAAELAVLR
jgi:hypothetical protein